jgi:probable HAF family extracellular repeat protein
LISFVLIDTKEGKMLRKVDSIRPINLAVSLFALALLSPAVTLAQANNLTDLGPYAPGRAINIAGQVVLQNYLYSGGTLTAFPANFFGHGINSTGQVVGSVGAGCLFVGQGCAIGVYANGGLTTSPILNGSLDPSVGNFGLGINTSGEIVGGWTMSHGQGGALALTSGVFSGIGFFPNICGGSVAVAAGIAFAINDAGQIVDAVPYDPTMGGGSTCVWHAFLLSQSVYHDIGIGEAYAISAAGEVVGGIQAGNATAGITTHAFSYTLTGGTPIDLGTLPGDYFSIANGIDGAGVIVGSSIPYTGSLYTDSGHAILDNGVMLDLNSFISADPLLPYVSLTSAQAINDSGMVVINGVDSRTQAKHVYLLQVPLVTVSPGPLSYGPQAINTVSAPQTVTFTNAGTTTVILGTASITGSFAIHSNTCAMALAQSATCSIAVSYAPTAGGSASGGLTLTADGAPLLVPLSQSVALISAGQSALAVGTAATLTWTAPSGAYCMATGGSASDGWTGSITASGAHSVTETAPGTFSYGLSCIVGSQVQTATVTPAVVVAWPVVTATLSASPTTVTVGHPSTLTWTSTNATSCVSSGGGSNDGWPATRTTNGSAPVTEPTALSTSSETVIYTITCTSSASGLSAKAMATVIQTAPSSGGGGSFDLLTLLLLGMLPALRRLRRRTRSAEHRIGQYTM